ncbi:MAG: anhydro-N-acetylmuramic acid kinase [Chlorobiales bacterium]|nr:anhydro-N-acetylmuramic acid kinase [Chlorobiales bacterium]
MRVLIGKPPEKGCIGVGVLSGTSVDGIDVGLVRLCGAGENTKAELLAFRTYPIPKAIREKILRNLNPEKATLQELSQLHFLIGDLFADAVQKLLDEENFPKKNLDFVASHGQTFWHQPTPERIGKHFVRSTFQLGEASLIAAKLGVVTVSDFRPAELPLGGEGAPLMPYLDYILFRHPKQNRALLNIGGISNITVLKKGCKKNEVIFFDCGPGNILLDKAAQHFFQKPYDRDARFAKRGKVSEKILDVLLKEPYYRLPPPKSTGRELFSDAYFERILQICSDAGLSGPDVIATLTELTVLAISQQYITFVLPAVQIDELIVSGGGAQNPLMMTRLQQVFPSVRVVRQDDLQQSPNERAIPAKAKESVLFAVLGNDLLSGLSASLRTKAMLGKISLPPVS